MVVFQTTFVVSCIRYIMESQQYNIISSFQHEIYMHIYTISYTRPWMDLLLNKKIMNGLMYLSGSLTIYRN